MSLGDLLGPEFAANPRELFGPDNYHPSAEGYATAAMAVLPTLCAVLGLWPESRPPGRRPPRGHAAGGEGGVRGGGGGGHGGHGRAGPWALLKHRRRRRLPAPGAGEEPAAAPGAPDAAGSDAGARATRRAEDVPARRARRARAVPAAAVTALRPATGRDPRLSGRLEKRSASHAPAR